MRRIKTLIILSVTIILSATALALAGPQYREVDTIRGRVITGLDKEKAYQLFGIPTAKSKNLWYYTGSSPAEVFFVSFPENYSSIVLYPNFYKAVVGIPLEFKVFLNLPDSGIRDITKDVQLVFDPPESVRIAGAGVIIPKKTGECSVLAIYQNILLSNPLYLKVDSEGSTPETKEELLSIDLLPYRPLVPVEGTVDFIALGTFFNYDVDEYAVRDISSQVIWSMRQRPNLTWNEQPNRRLYFSKKGVAEVLSQYQGAISFPQRVEIKDKVDYGLKRLKHIFVLPDVVRVTLGNSMNLRAFGTYYDNSVVELTQEVKWKIAEPSTLESNKNGYFSTKSEGITEVTAAKDGVESLPVKVAVINRSKYFINTGSEVNSGKKDIPNLNWPEQIKDNIEKLKKDFLVKGKELKKIQIMPESLDLGLGEEGKFSATGIYNDGSFSDLTILGSWEVLNKDVASVSGGKVISVAVGQTSAYVEFKGVRSEYARVVVGAPKLISLLLTPQSLRIPRDGKAVLKVLGNYYDHSQRDLTKEVSWGREGPLIAKIEKGVLRPLKFGQSKIYAEYFRLKSNPARIEVIFTLGWLLWLLAKIMLVLLLSIFCAAFILYLFAQKKRRQLQLLKDKPREFILKLYDNASRLTVIFGQRYDAHIPPLSYAELVRNKFSVEGNDFINLSIKFEEAKYSKHLLEEDHANLACRDYNRFFEKMLSNQSKLQLLYRYCLSLVYCRPIFIFSTP
jgi:hypothetical protein